MKPFLILMALIVLSSSESNISSFVIGNWRGKESIHIRISELSIDKWVDVQFNVIFTNDGMFDITTGDLLYDIALQDYAMKTNLNYNSYVIEESLVENIYSLKLFNQGTENKVVHKLKKLKSSQMVLRVKLGNGENKDILLNKVM